MRMFPVRKGYMLLVIYHHYGTIRIYNKTSTTGLTAGSNRFIQFLIEKRMHKKGTYLKLDWAGALSEYKNKYTSLSLQKKR